MPNDYEQLKMDVENLKRELASMQSAATVNPQIFQMVNDVVGSLTLGDLADVDDTGITNGQLLKWNSTSAKYLPANDIDT